MTVPASPALEPVEGDLRELRQSFQEPAEPQKPSFEKNLPQEYSQGQPHRRRPR